MIICIWRRWLKCVSQRAAQKRRRMPIGGKPWRKRCEHYYKTRLGTWLTLPRVWSRSDASGCTRSSTTMIALSNDIRSDLLGLIPATTDTQVQRSRYLGTYRKQTVNAKLGHKILTSKTQNREKPRGLTNPNETINDSEPTTLSSSSSTDGGRVSNSYTLTLSLLHSYWGNDLL